MSKPTIEQQKVIDSTFQKIKVSANAGSGKTFTIMQRIAQIIKNGSSRLDQLLVLTFTDASAQDMRKKLKEQLGNLVSPVELQAASIGTFHSFCANLVRSWFTVAEVSPSFVVMDEIESTKIKTTIFDQIVLDHYQEVAAAVDLFAVSRKLDELRQVVFSIHNFLATREDRDVWLRDQALLAYETNINQNLVIQALIDDYHQITEKYRQYLLEAGNPSPHLDCLIDAANQILAAQTYADFARLSFNFPRAKNGELKTQSDDFKKLRDDFRNQICKSIMSQFKYPVAQIQTDIQTDRRVVEQLLRLVQIFDDAYQTKKTEYKKLDFNDLEKYALKVLANPEAATSIRAQFKYIFVDEGQDTNPVQFKIINLLRGEDKFFCIVGDVKQSIYGFRDCEPEIFEGLKDQNGTLVPVLLLGKNFRSVDSILHFVNTVMQPLIPNYATEHQFTAIGEPDPQAIKQAVTIEIAQNKDAQMELVYQRILTAQKTLITEDFVVNGQQTKRQVPLLAHGLQDIAVLSETGTNFERLQKYLAERGIPSVIDRNTDALNEPEVVLLNHFLFAALNPTNELSRYLVLQYLFGCTDDDLAHLRLNQIGDDLAQKIAQCNTTLTKYRQLCRTEATYEVLTQVATEFGMLELPVVNAFLTAIRGVRDFDTVARYLYLVEHQLVKIEINVGACTQDAVKLMTIHHAKGLEFPVVILFNMGTSWQRQHKDSVKVAIDKHLGICVASVDTENFALKSPILQFGIKKYQEQRALQEKIRLLYVALTRAQKQMAIIGSWQRNPYLIRPDSMLDLIHPLGVIEYDEVVASPKKTSGKKQVQPHLNLCPTVGNPDVLVKQSVTALATAAEEPFQDYVVPVKFEGQGGKAFGTAYHRQMQYGDLPAVVQSLVEGYTVYRELPFLYLEQQTIVQGIMDLLAVKDQQAIIVDYKTTRLPREKLVVKYREQLRLYAQALPDYQVRTYLYSTVHNALIEVSF